MGPKPKQPNVIRTKLDQGWREIKPMPIHFGDPRIDARLAKLQKKLAVAEALAADRQRTADEQRKANQAIAVNTSAVADRFVQLRDRLGQAEQALEDERHELEKAQALAAGFRARAEKAEAALAEMTSARDGLRAEVNRLQERLDQAQADAGARS